MVIPLITSNTWNNKVITGASATISGSDIGIFSDDLDSNDDYF